MSAKSTYLDVIQICLIVLLPLTAQTVNAEIASQPILAPISSYNPKDKEFMAGFVPFEQDGLCGLLYNEEVCLLPIYDNLTTKTIYSDGYNRICSEPNYHGYIGFREGGKWGVIKLPDKIITQPVYDNLCFIINRGFSTHIYILVCSDGKFGLLNGLGYTLIAPKYGTINGPFFFQSDNRNYYGRDFPYFIVSDNADGSNPYIVDVVGNQIDAKFVLDTELCNSSVCNSDKKFEQLAKSVQSAEKSLYKRDKKLKKEEQWDYNRYICWLDERQCPEVSRFSFEAKDCLPLKVGEDITLSGFRGKVNDLGFIDIPCYYQEPDDIAQRDPGNIFLVEKQLDKFIRETFPRYRCPAVGEDWSIWREFYQREYDNAHANRIAKETILEIAEKRGYADSPLYRDYQQELPSYIEHEKRCKKDLSTCEGTIAFNQKVDGVVSTIETIANAIGQATGLTSNGETEQSVTSAANISSLPVTNNDNNSKRTHSQKNSNNLGEHQAYLTDKRTYERYDSQLSSHFAGNQKMSDTASAQRKMKQLRQKWESRGKSFPHSANEDR